MCTCRWMTEQDISLPNAGDFWGGTYIEARKVKELAKEHEDKSWRWDKWNPEWVGWGMALSPQPPNPRASSARLSSFLQWEAPITAGGVHASNHEAPFHFKGCQLQPQTVVPGRRYLGRRCLRGGAQVGGARGGGSWGDGGRVGEAQAFRVGVEGRPGGLRAALCASPVLGMTHSTFHPSTTYVIFGM